MAIGQAWLSPHLSQMRGPHSAANRMLPFGDFCIKTSSQVFQAGLEFAQCIKVEFECLTVLPLPMEFQGHRYV